MSLPIELRQCINNYAKREHYQINTISDNDNDNDSINIVLTYNYGEIEGTIIFGYCCFIHDMNLLALKEIKQNKSYLYYL